MTDTDQEHTFDWVSRHDPASLAYPITAVLPPVLPSRRLWRPGPVLNQRAEGACVGHAWTNEATASPVRVDVPSAALPGRQTDAARSPWPRQPQPLAFAVYHEAQRVDEWAGESYEGTSVLAGAKVMRSLGFLREFRWAFSVADLRAAVLGHGPAVLGIPWLDGMYDAPGGEIRATGEVVGGHAILCNGYEPDLVLNGQPPRPMFGLFNSWGPGWGQYGQAWIGVDDLASLVRGQGEMCVPVHRSYGRESTLRRLLRGLFGRS